MRLMIKLAERSLIPDVCIRMGIRNMDRRRDEVLAVLGKVYGRSVARRWFQRWRIFFMACAELWGYAKGQEWVVSHYRLRKP